MFSLTEIPEVIKTSQSLAISALSELQLKLQASDVVKGLEAPLMPADVETFRKEGSKYITHRVSSDGHLVVGGVECHPLQVFAGLAGGQVGDVPATSLGDRGAVESGDAFMPFVTHKSNEFVMVASGQHDRNRNELMFLGIEHEYRANEEGLDKCLKLRTCLKLAEGLFLKGNTLVIVKKIEKGEFFPEPLLAFADPILRAKDNLVQLSQGSSSSSMFYFKGDHKSMDSKELVEILCSQNGDFPLEFNAAGKALAYLKPTGRVALGKWFKEVVTEVGAISNSYSYRTDKLTAEVIGNEYVIKAPMKRPIKPAKDKGLNHQESLNWFWDNKLAKKEFDSLLVKMVASGMEVEHPQSKELLHALKAVSDWAKTEVLAKSLVDAGVAGILKVEEFVRMTGALQGGKISGKNPLTLGMYPLTIYDEGKTLDRKVDEAFVDQLKVYGVLDVRGMNQKVNTMIKGHQVLVMARQTMSSLDNVHDEILNRLVRLVKAGNKPFPKDTTKLKAVRHALTWYIYEECVEHINTLMDMNDVEGIAYCQERLNFQYAAERAAEQVKSSNMSYSVLCEVIKVGAQEMLDWRENGDGDGWIDPNFKYHKDQHVIACRHGEIAFTSKSAVYGFASMNAALSIGFRDDITEVFQSCVSRKPKANGQVSVQPLKIKGSKSVGFVYRLDVDVLMAGKITEKIEAMSEEEVIARVADMKGNITPEVWSYIALRLIQTESVEVAVHKGGLDDFTG